MSKVLITETVLRDAHQSLAATRMTIDDMIPILEIMDEVGYYSLECWGGATFDSCVRFLNEDPWERLRKIRKACPNTKLQMLLRGQNLLGYKHYADDVVEYFVKKSVSNGIDIIRIFDALNDFRNIEKSMKAAISEGVHAQGCIAYTTSPFHTVDKFVEDAKRLEEMGAHSVCIKDMAGLLLPMTAYEMVKKMKETLTVPIVVHTHYTSGVGSMTYLKAIEAGCNVVDTAISPLALGTSQPPTEPLVATLKGTEYDTELSLDKLSEVAAYFSKIREKLLDAGLIDPHVLTVDINALRYQVPGGMMSNLVSQLKQADRMDKLMDVLQEVPKVREDFGFPPLVTPSSQIVGTQAVLNVVTGERYKMVTNEAKGLLRGEYGLPPAPINEEVYKAILGDEPKITYRPADKIEPELEINRKAVAPYYEQEEDVLTWAMFPQVAEKFFKERRARLHLVDDTDNNADERIQPV